MPVRPPSAPPRQYDVLIGRGLIPNLGAHVAAVLRRESGHALLVADEHLPDATATAAAESLRRAGYRFTLVRPRVHEHDKSLRAAKRLATALATARHERRDPVIALGGGIVGDLAGFAAAVYRRGVPLIHCPTTLLAMVDASIGGKTAVNMALPAGPGAAPTLRKNMLGAFHQPVAVLADLDTLDSLPDRDLRCGLAECLKHGLIAGSWGDPTLFSWTVENLALILARDPAVLAALVRRNVALKAAVVAADEREDADDDGRMALNLGHTFAHALEAVEALSPTASTDDAPLRHGEAVALGLLAAARCAVDLGLAPAELTRRLAAAIGAAGLPTAVRNLPASPSVLSLMLDDKKVSGGSIRLVLPTPDCTCRIVRDPPPPVMLRAIDSLRAS